MLTDYFNTVNAAGKKYLRELGLFFTFFILVVTFFNLTHKIFGFTLIPIVKTGFDAFHDWCAFILDVFVFSWVTYSLEWIWYGLTWLCSLLAPIIPWRPQINIPSLVTDIALVSLAFTRVFQSADLIVPRLVRAEAEVQMTPNLWKEIEIAEGSLWGPAHRFLDRTNARIWKLIEAIQRILCYPFRSFPKFCLVVRLVLITLAGSAFMWGFIRLGGYLINVYAARHLTSPIMEVRKRFFKYFGLNLLGAIAATLIFIVLNGWLAEWTE